MAEASQKGTSAHRILARAHSPNTTSRIYEDKIHHKPLHILPSTGKADPKDVSKQLDARQLRRQRRLAQANARSRKSKLKAKPPLSAREKRKLCLHDIPRHEAKYDIYKGLHQLWCGYIRDVLGLSSNAGEGSGRRHYVSAPDAGPKLLSADLHGAELEVIRSRCVGRVGIKGLVVRDTKFTFTLVTREDALKTIPKEHTVFRFEVPFENECHDEGNVGHDVAEAVPVSSTKQAFVFELQGSSFKNRAPERANKKFKMHKPEDL